MKILLSLVACILLASCATAPAVTQTVTVTPKTITVTPSAAPPAPPAVRTDNAMGITTASAVLSGTLTGKGTAATVAVSFQWGVSQNYTAETTPVSVNAMGPFEFMLSGLASDTVFHYRAKAAGDAIGYGDDKTFATLPPPVPRGNADARSRSLGTATVMPMVSTRGAHTVGLKSNGTVVAVGLNDDGQCNVSSWTGITQVSAGSWWHTVGLKSDGTVAAVGSNVYGQCNVSSWTGITQVSAGERHTAGLKSDGTVVAVGYNVYGQCNVSSWTGITQVSTGGWHTVGLKSDGTVVAVGSNVYGQCNVSSWTGITQVSAGINYTLGLKSDGTVAAVGLNDDGQRNVSSWTGITRISAGERHTVGLKSDGTVVAVGLNDDGQRNVSSWTGITQVSAGWIHTVGLKSDGTVVAVGSNDYGQCNISSWNLIVPDKTPLITRQPQDTVAQAGSAATFTANATGSPPPIVQWQVLPVGGTWTDIVGATSPIYTFTAQVTDNGKQYRAAFTNSVGNAISNAASLIVIYPPGVTQQPQDTVVQAGSAVSFTANATGNPPPIVQWMVLPVGGTWTFINGATSTTYTFTAQMTDSGKQYRAFFINSIGNALTDAASLTVIAR